MKKLLQCGFLDSNSLIPKTLHKTLTFLIALVWLINGLVCKVLNFVPRHEQIVARILGDENSRLFTILIGISEIIMTIWVITKFKSKLNAIAQIIIVATMNLIEFILVPELLLWRRFNIIFAFLFIGIVYYNEFVLNKKLNPQTTS
ncbi:DoxX-like family protein [Marivirga salinae]|uniref:DoxX-like family protein n=1 Tax=Marivirga salinarum TaxID=3059078 RepID=A0AA49J9I0_9BACT|nr:DoxX-like family protein [Marivirga sp. BDSF4-3]WKK76635.1 DoxX-like family protein [Marivirga sp. BDSF4-3]